MKYQHQAKLLLAARKRAGLSQKSLATQLRYGVSQFVSNWERGVSQVPDKKLPVVCELLLIEEQEMIAARLNDATDDLHLIFENYRIKKTKRNPPRLKRKVK